MDTIEKTSPNLRYLQPTLWLRNVSGQFLGVVAADPFQRDGAGRGALLATLTAMAKNRIQSRWYRQTDQGCIGFRPKAILYGEYCGRISFQQRLTGHCRSLRGFNAKLYAICL